MFCKNQLQLRGFLLCLVISTQYVHAANHLQFDSPEDIARFIQSDDKSLMPLDFDQFYNDARFKDLRSVSDDKISDNAMCETALENGKCPLERPREKRLVTAILFAISIFATVANLAFDIYLQLEGCCGIYPSACTYKDQFDTLKTFLEKKSDEMNDLFTKCQNDLEYVKAGNQNNADIWQEITRIMTLQKRIMLTLDTDVISKYDKESRLIENQLRAHNKTVAKWTNEDFNMSYDGVFSSLKSAAIGLAPLVGMLGFKAITSGIKWYKGVKVAKTVKSSAHLLTQSTKANKILGVKNVNSFVKQTASVQSKALSSASKMTKFKAIGGAVMSVIAIGFEIFLAVKKVQACEKKRDKAKEAVEELTPEKKKFEETEKQLKELEANLTISYDETKGNITTDVFLEYTLKLKSFAQGSDVQPASLQQAAINLQTFHDTIKTANKDMTVSLQTSFISSLRNIEFTWDCFDKKISTVTYVYEYCKKGLQSIEWLFKNATVTYSTFEGKCTTSVGHTYTTLAVTKKYVEDRMKIEGYFQECILNNKNMMKVVCSNYAKNVTDETTAEERGLEVSQVKFMITHCPKEDVSPRVKKLICGLVADSNLKETKEKYKKYNQTQIEAVYKSCPQPTAEDLSKTNICFYKRSGYTMQQAITKYNQFASNLVTTQFNECINEISASRKVLICATKKMGNSVSRLLAYFGKDYPQAMIEAAYQACPSK